MRVLCRWAGGDLIVDIELGSGPDTSVAELARDLIGLQSAPEGPVDPAPDPDSDGTDLGIRIDGTWYPPATPVGSLPLWEGSLLEPALRPPRLQSLPPPSARILAVTGGLRAGERHRLPERAGLVIGRGEDADLALSDPSISRRHALLRLGATPTITDLGSTNGTRVNGRPVGGTASVGPGDVIRLGATRLVWRHDRDDSPVGLDDPVARHGGTTTFNRPPRRAPPVEPAVVSVPAAAPPPPDPEPLSWAGVFLPVIAGGVVASLLLSPLFALFAALGPVLTVGTWYERTRRARRSAQAERRAVEDARARMAADLPALVELEQRRLSSLAPDPAEVIRRATTPSIRCWERRPSDPDHLMLGLGSADLPWDPPISVAGEGSPDREALDSIGEVGPLPDAPVIVRLGPGQLVGLVGDPTVTRPIAASLVLQAAVHHGPADLAVSVVGLAERGGPEDIWAWARWLPHTTDTVTGARGALVSGGPDQAAAVVEAAGSDPSPRCRLVVIDGQPGLVERESVGRILLGDERVGGIALVGDERLLPASCTAVVVADHPSGRVRVIEPRSETVVDGVSAWGVEPHRAALASRSLARFVDPDLDGPSADLPTSVGLLELHDNAVDAASVVSSWRSTRSTAELSSPIGVGRDGPIRLDLVNDGPHVLIGGTTGSGKSELLRSLVAGLALAADPEHVAFVLVDYKGGAAFDACLDLPHVAGLVTDLDDRLAERALRCLEAELRYREARLREVGAEDLATFRISTSGGDRAPLPRLVVVVDEFASLAADIPDFLESLVGIARQGRSLGVHLVLATQRPTGVITDEIRANVGCRVALRVTDRHDSTDVIDSPVAASIPRPHPGRAFARLGPGELIAFQTALATGRSQVGSRVRVVDPSRPADPDETDVGIRTDLEQVVEATRAAHRAVGTRAPRSPWPPPLPASIPLDSLAPTPDGAAWLADDPFHQTRRVGGWTPTDGHLVVLGSPGSGTTSTLATVVLDLADRFETDQLHIQIIDLDSGRLGPLAGLPHVGAVIEPGDADRRVRLLRMIDRHIAAARRFDDPDGTDVVLLIDDLGGLARAHDPVREPEIGELLARIWADGPSARVRVVASARRAADLPPALAATVGSVLVHRVNEGGEGLRFGCRIDSSDFPPGRAWRTRDGLEIQVGTLGGDLARAVEKRAASAEPVTNPPELVGSLDEPVDWRTLPAEVRANGGRIGLVFARDDVDLEPCGIDLGHGEHALIVGPPGSGRTDLLGVIGRGLAQRAIVIGDDDTALVARSGLRFARPEEVPSLAETTDMVLLVDDAERVDDPTGRLHEILIGRRGPRIVASAAADRIRSTFGHWSADLRSCRSGVILHPTPLDGDLLGVALPPRIDLPRRPGRGVLVDGGRIRVIQVARLCG